MLRDALKPYAYLWPYRDPQATRGWSPIHGGKAFVQEMPEKDEALATDSRWPAFFPSPTCIVTASCGNDTAMERLVGATIVDRFPYTVALSLCRRDLSLRHHARKRFIETVEQGGNIALQFLPPGNDLDRVLKAIATVPDDQTNRRIEASGVPVRKAGTNDSPVFCSAYMIYEATLVRPGRDFEGQPIYETPWKDVGSHRVYFFEINAIQLREDIALGRSQIHWRSLPAWSPASEMQGLEPVAKRVGDPTRYQKGYTPFYSFPSASTIAFEADAMERGFAIRSLPPLPVDQVEVDNERARWPCFFPSSVGMITTWADGGMPNLMPCGSTTILSRQPFTVGVCISYAAINERYAPRASLEFIQKSGRFGCSVPFIHDAVVEAIRYAGNNSFRHDPEKGIHAGLEVEEADWAPILASLPIHYDCEVIEKIRLGTHMLFIGEVRRIRVRADVTDSNAIEWCPWADVDPLISQQGL